jgi:hypothetical protein
MGQRGAMAGIAPAQRQCGRRGANEAAASDERATYREVHIHQWREA